ncbi:MAG: hypothetical protein PHP17_00385 [Candidatus Omnitrophica bacterium]|nr:hypothetical protein [Candidatus Omnitrophota bacterium]
MPEVVQSNPSFFAQICDPRTLANYLALILNVIVLIINICWSVRNRKNERKYNLEYAFYELSILKSFVPLIEFSSLIRKRLNLLITESRNANVSGANILAIVHQHIEVLDAMWEDLQFKNISLMKGYDAQLGEIIYKATEELYDGATDIFTKFNRTSTPIELERNMGNKLSALSSQYIKNIFVITKKYCPQH